MIPKTLSVSIEFNSVSEFAQLLYVMMQPYTDDFGRIDGEAGVIKALVLPMNKRPVTDFELAIKELVKVEQIEFYVVGKQKVISIPTFEADQTGLNKRTTSRYPDNSKNFQEVPRITTPKEVNGTEENIEVNKTEVNKSEDSRKVDADKGSLSYKGIVNPKSFIPSSEGELMALETWKRLEPNNGFSLASTYLKALEKRLPLRLFGQFASEIEQDKTIMNRGAVFNKKVNDYLTKK